MSQDNPEQSRTPFVSVVIGFKDWGLERLELSVRSIHDSLAGIDHEVIISDYGSEDTTSVAEAANNIGAVHVVVETDGEWSRSRALNAGVRASTGSIILATDADMLFTPRALTRTVEQLELHPQEIVILQCRDLPVGYSHEAVLHAGFDWDEFLSISRIRPRWGMGGLVAIRRELWERLRGWDERMHTYGGEDIDLATRAQALGARIDWLDEVGVGMFHIWHPSSGARAAHSPAATAAISENRRIYTSDRTIARNRVRPRFLPRPIAPLVSVIVDGSSGGADLLESTLLSVLGQSVGDIEVFVSAADSLPDDPRVCAVPEGAVDVRGAFVAAAHPGDVWSEHRLEHLLEHWLPGVGLISDRTALLLRDMEPALASPPPVLPLEVPDPWTTLVRSALLPSPIETSQGSWVHSVRSAASSGAEWVVAPECHHVTTSALAEHEALSAQRRADTITVRTSLARCGLHAPEIPQGGTAVLGNLATAILFGGDLVLTVSAPASTDLSSVGARFQHAEGWLHREVRTSEGDLLAREIVWRGDNLRHATEMRRRFESIGAHVSWRIARDEDPVLLPAGDALSLVQLSEPRYGVHGEQSTWLTLPDVPSSRREEVSTALGTLPAVTAVLDLVTTSNGAERPWLLARLSSASVPEALSLAAALPFRAGIEVFDLSPSSQEVDASP